MAAYMSVADLPQVIPLFPLNGALLLPRGLMPLNIFEPRYLNMIDDAMSGERILGLIQTRSGGDRAKPALAAVGCAGRITSYAETSDGRYLITLTGVCRFRLGDELPTPTPYRQARALYEAFEADLHPSEDLSAGDRTQLLDGLAAFLQGRGLEIDWDQAKDAPLEALINSLSMALPFDGAEKQALLEALTLHDRHSALVTLLHIGAASPGGDDEPTPSMQ
jgi:Lon protease-like protein